MSVGEEPRGDGSDVTAERDESKENRDAVTSVPFRYARYTLYTPSHPFSSLSNHAVGRRDRRDRSHV